MLETLERAEEFGNDITVWRRDFHMHPELGFEEYRTSKRVAEILQEMGWNVKTNVGKTGVVATLGEGSPVVAIRADMDALPILEANEVEYASQNEGKMHACGHDSHTAMLLGVAKIFASMDERPAGEIRLLFQPAEEMQDAEGKSGAYRMIEDGAMEGVDYVIAQHVASDLPAGKIVIEDEFITAACDQFYGKIIGKGCHAASPHEGIDPIFIAAQVINAIQGVRSRRTNPVHPVVVTIGAIHGGTVENVIPKEVTLIGTIRTYDEDIRQQTIQEVERAFSVAEAMGGTYELDIVHGCPSTYNAPKVSAVIRQTAIDLFGEDSILPMPAGLGGEDFSYMTQKAPGAMFMLGAKKDDVDRPHHNPVFDLSEETFPKGAALLAETALRLLKNGA